MSLTDLIDDLTENSANLRAAMQGADVVRIEEAVDAFCASLEAVRAVGQWPADSQIRAKFEALAPELEQSRALACLLADMTGQMHDLAVSRAPQARQPLYGRTGERFA
jgi:hypothetical protein